MGRILSPVKHDTYSEYDHAKASLVERALLSVWPCLEPWFDELVLVGGLVPRYICAHQPATSLLPRPVTLDADLGIALGASAGGMSSIQDALRDEGFCETKRGGSTRYEKQVDGHTIPIDFLTEVPSFTNGARIVDDIVASVLPGVDRALANARQVPVTGRDLAGRGQTIVLRVCEVGPFLAMKLRAFAGREEGKDAFDILYTLSYYDGGTTAAVDAFEQEIRAGNAACDDAVACLHKYFLSEDSLGPRKAGQFYPGPVSDREPPDLHAQRERIQQEMVSAANLLIKVVPVRPST
jgi:hypothetical protein